MKFHDIIPYSFCYKHVWGTSQFYKIRLLFQIRNEHFVKHSLKDSRYRILVAYMLILVKLNDTFKIYAKQ